MHFVSAEDASFPPFSSILFSKGFEVRRKFQTTLGTRLISLQCEGGRILLASRFQELCARITMAEIFDAAVSAEAGADITPPCDEEIGNLKRGSPVSKRRLCATVSQGFAGPERCNLLQKPLKVAGVGLRNLRIYAKRGHLEGDSLIQQ